MSPTVVARSQDVVERQQDLPFDAASAEPVVASEVRMWGRAECTSVVAVIRVSALVPVIGWPAVMSAPRTQSSRAGRRVRATAGPSP